MMRSAEETPAQIFAHEVGNLVNNMYLQAQLLERQIIRDDARDDRSGASADPTKRTRLRLIMGEMQRLTTLLAEFREL
jgi:hypothetical protein